MKDELLGAAYIVVLTLIAGFIVACGIGIVIDHSKPPIVVGSMSTPVFIETPIPIDETYQPVGSTITYQVESMDRNNYRVITTSGEVLYFDNYDEWDTQVIRCVYTAVIVGQSGGTYRVKHPRIEVAYIPADGGRGHGRYVSAS